MSNTPSLVDVYYHRGKSRPLAGVLRVFVDCFGHDLEFRERASPAGELELALRSIELDSMHLAAVLQALREEQTRLLRSRQRRNAAQVAEFSAARNARSGPVRTVGLIRHATKSGLASGVLRIDAKSLREQDLPWHEHVSRNGRFVVQLHSVQFDVVLLDAALDVLTREENHLRRMRGVFNRAASSLMLMSECIDEAEESTP